MSYLTDVDEKILKKQHQKIMNNIEIKNFFTIILIMFMTNDLLKNERRDRSTARSQIFARQRIQSLTEKHQ